MDGLGLLRREGNHADVRDPRQGGRVGRRAARARARPSAHVPRSPRHRPLLRTAASLDAAEHSLLPPCLRHSCPAGSTDHHRRRGSARPAGRRAHRSHGGSDHHGHRGRRWAVWPRWPVHGAAMAHAASGGRRNRPRDRPGARTCPSTLPPKRRRKTFPPASRSISPPDEKGETPCTSISS